MHTCGLDSLHAHLFGRSLPLWHRTVFHHHVLFVRAHNILRSYWMSLSFALLLPNRNIPVLSVIGRYSVVVYVLHEAILPYCTALCLYIATASPLLITDPVLSLVILSVSVVSCSLLVAPFAVCNSSVGRRERGMSLVVVGACLLAGWTEWNRFHRRFVPIHTVNMIDVQLGKQPVPPPWLLHRANYSCIWTWQQSANTHMVLCEGAYVVLIPEPAWQRRPWILFHVFWLIRDPVEAAQKYGRHVEARIAQALLDPFAVPAARILGYADGGQGAKRKYGGGSICREEGHVTYLPSAHKERARGAQKARPVRPHLLRVRHECPEIELSQRLYINPSSGVHYAIYPPTSMCARSPLSGNVDLAGFWTKGVLVLHNVSLHTELPSIAPGQPDHLEQSCRQRSLHTLTVCTVSTHSSKCAKKREAAAVVTAEEVALRTGVSAYLFTSAPMGALMVGPTLKRRGQRGIVSSLGKDFIRLKRWFWGASNRSLTNARLA